MISMLRAKKLINCDCIAYLATMVKDRKGISALKDIPIIQEYLNVFRTKLLGVPSDEKIEFAIDLISETTLISKAPYQMAPSELKEWKVQLQDLLQRLHQTMYIA